MSIKSNAPAFTFAVSGLKQHPQIDRLTEILRRHIQARCDAKVVRAQNGAANADFHLSLQIDAELGAESFRLDTAPNKTTLTGGDLPGVLYGLGRFLRTCRFAPHAIFPSEKSVESRPEKQLRGMYFATHFHNYYHDAPLPEIIRYVEDLALWGVNTIQVWFDMHQYRGIEEPAAQAMIERLRSILTAVKALGLRACLVHLGNEAYAESPPELRADFNTRRATYDVELCPNKPGATELLLRWYAEVLQAFPEFSPDYIVFGLYDQGGCACEKCHPWGANGYLQITQAKAKLTREYLPDAKIILSTWLFDYAKDQGEWSGLSKKFAQKPDWCDYIQADSHETFPTFPLKNGVPGDLPLLNFPEISMWMMHPWGGFGANPLPQRFQNLFESVEPHLSGGFPYSKGIYEDINKVFCLQRYWDSKCDARDILREYTAYEYSPDVVDDVLEVIATLEKNHNHLWTMNWESLRQTRFTILYQADPHAAFAKMKDADAKLSERAKTSWRWRSLYLRALLDAELHATQGFWGGELCEQAFEELTAIFHATSAEYKCAPPTKLSSKNALSSERAVAH